jgi:GTP cyclohydrolase II
VSKFKKQGEASIPTEWGQFNLIAYSTKSGDQMPPLCMIHESTDLSSPILVRIHSECITGDLFHSQRCDCGQQLEEAMKLIGEKGGALLYLRQEGRGIGIINKLHAYNKQDEGMDTIEANEALGFESDNRNYKIAVDILEDLQVSRIRLLTNNPDKIEAFQNSDIHIDERIPLVTEPTEQNKKYMKTKQESLGHLYKL